jgi:hypothetical protein
VHENEVPVVSSGTTFSAQQGETIVEPVTFTDPDGDSILPTSRQVIDSNGVNYYSNGELTYEIEPSATVGQVTLTAIATDQFGKTGETDIILTIEELDGELVAVDQSWTVTEDTLFNSKVDAGITGADLYADELNNTQDQFTFSPVVQPQNGVLFIEENTGEFIFKYMPDENYFGSDELSIRVSDGEREVVSSVTINVTSVADPAEWLSPVTIETKGNIPQELNLMDYVENVDNATITFTTVNNATTANGSEYSITSAGVMTYIPAINMGGFNEEIDVGFSDGTTTYSNNTITAIVDSEVIKLYDINSTGTNSGNVLNPYNNIDDLLAGLTINDVVYLCAGSTTINATKTLVSDIIYTGYNPNDKHEYNSYCANTNSTTMTTFVMEDDLDVFELANNIELHNLKFIHNGENAAIFTGSAVENIQLINSDITNNRSTVSVVNATDIKGLIVKEQNIFTTDLAYQLTELSGENVFENITTDSVNNMLTINTIKESNTSIHVANLLIPNYADTLIDIVDMSNPNTIINFELLIENNEIATSSVDGQIAYIELTQFNQPVVTFENNELTLMKASDVNLWAVSNAKVLMDNNIINLEAGGIMNYAFSGPTSHHVEIGNNTIDVMDGNDDIETPFAFTINHGTANETYNNTVIWKNNTATNSLDRVFVNGQWITATFDNDVSGVRNRFNVLLENGSIKDDENDIMNLDFANNDDQIRLNATYKNIDLVKSFGANQSFSSNENNLVESCVNFESSYLNNLELFKDQTASDIKLYDPNNNGSNSIQNRNLSVGTYNVQGYTYTANPCAVPQTVLSYE